MKLNKEHRSALLTKLSIANKKIETIKAVMNKGEDVNELINLWEIDLFLAEKEVELIERSLIDNEIDF